MISRGNIEHSFTFAIPMPRKQAVMRSADGEAAVRGHAVSALPLCASVPAPRLSACEARTPSVRSRPSEVGFALVAQRLDRTGHKRYGLSQKENIGAFLFSSVSGENLAIAWDCAVLQHTSTHIIYTRVSALYFFIK